jgi:hypothetical protein
MCYKTEILSTIVTVVNQGVNPEVALTQQPISDKAQTQKCGY